jgi:asparagine synthase (glutamine-hydrolysing)
VLRPERVRTVLDDHRSRRHDNHKLLFSLALFEEWLRTSCAGPAHGAITR